MVKRYAGLRFNGVEVKIIILTITKSELLVKFYERATVRGYEVVQFNLINSIKTNIYNRVPRFIMKSYNII